MAPKEDLLWQIDNDDLVALDYVKLMETFATEVRAKDGLILQGQQYSLSASQKDFWGSVYEANGDSFIDFTLVSLKSASEFADYKEWLLGRSVNKPVWLIWDLKDVDYTNARVVWNELTKVFSEEVDVVLIKNINLLDTNSSRLLSYFTIELLHGLFAADYSVNDLGTYWDFSVAENNFKVKKDVNSAWNVNLKDLNGAVNYLGNEVSTLSEADVIW